MEKKSRRVSDGMNPRSRHAMANTYTSLFYHVTFSTKDRIHWIKREIENRVWEYAGGVARQHKMSALEIGGFPDHLHALIMAPPTISPSQIAQILKGDSSKWIHDSFQEMKMFSWQDGYGAFTVSKSKTPEVIQYIKNQREHHRHRTFQEEYLELLEKHGIQYDERYLWG